MSSWGAILFEVYVASTASQYGLEIDMGKLQLIQVRCDDILHASDRKHVVAKDSMAYLGTLLHADGTVDRELKRRLGKLWRITISCSGYGKILY